jgi:hypothetical protein
MAPMVHLLLKRWIFFREARSRKKSENDFFFVYKRKEELRITRLLKK